MLRGGSIFKVAADKGVFGGGLTYGSRIVDFWLRDDQPDRIVMR